MDNVLYYESHITIDPVFDERLAVLKEVAAFYGFHVADLILRKSRKDPEKPHQDDSFLTGRDKNRVHLEHRMDLLIEGLQDRDFVIRRKKIEAALIDERL